METIKIPIGQEWAKFLEKGTQGDLTFKGLVLSKHGRRELEHIRDKLVEEYGVENTADKESRKVVRGLYLSGYQCRQKVAREIYLIRDNLLWFKGTKNINTSKQLNGFASEVLGKYEAIIQGYFNIYAYIFLTHGVEMKLSEMKELVYGARG